MNTRSKTKENKVMPELLVNIDFDDASKEWHKNKKAIGNSQYKYICSVVTNKNSKHKEKISKTKNENKIFFHFLFKIEYIITTNISIQWIN